jgi:ABC-type bacteriocin/lantibiotic exporter with double-glycine peptidase domain
VSAAPPARPRLLVPEVVQTSAMDCGPAALKCLLEGFGIAASYGRLREACQTDVDGTSIDTLEEVAVQLGLEAEQVMLPMDHVLLPEAQVLPAIVVVRLPSGVTHFVVAWRCHGGVVQLMDPAIGRRWPPQSEDIETAERLCRELGLGDLLARMPAGLWQQVGETGWQLSHGERSRLYMARALLQGAGLVILDESFAALDPETLRQAFRCVLERAPTLLVVAHP